MIDSLFIAATGMHAEQAQIDTVANNLVNMNTMGFKKSRVSFATLVPQTAQVQGVDAGLAAPAAGHGRGVAGGAQLADFSQGSLKQTLGEYDFAINGRGLFEVQLPDGSFAYSRNGALHVDGDGYLVNADGYPLSAMIQVPSDVEQLLVNDDGRVQLKIHDSSQLVDAGYLMLSHFANPAGLTPVGDNLYLANEAAGAVVYSRPGENGAGTINQGYLEGSNVQMIEELTTMMTAQRAYEANSRILQASDEILGIINNLRK